MRLGSSYCSRRGKVFVNIQGEPLRGYKPWFDPAVSEAWIKNLLGACFRHTFPSRLAMTEMDLRN